MALTPGSLVFVAYDGTDPMGAALGTLTHAVDKAVFVEDNGHGGGSFRISRHSSQADWCEPGNYVRVWRDTVSGSALAGFWIEEGADTLLSPDEQGGEELVRSGRGPIAVLREALAWSRVTSGGTGQVQPGQGRWFWQDAHPARPLVRLLEEAQARGCFPFLDWDFTRTLDSDGDPWDGDEAQSISIEIGKNLLDVVTVLRETGLHITCSPDFELQAWDEYERDLTGSITLTGGDDVRDSSERQTSIRRMVGALLVEGENKDSNTRYRATTSTTIVAEQGRRVEGFYAYPRTATSALLERVARRKMRKWRRAKDNSPLVIGTLDETGKVALVDYVPGDTVGIDVDGYALSEDRIGVITLRETEAGEYDPIVDFSDVSMESAPYHETRDGPVGGPSPSGGGGGGGGGAGGTSSGSGGCGCASDSITPVLIATSSDFSTGTSHTLDLPDGCDVEGRWLVVMLAFNSWTTDIQEQLEADGFSVAHNDVNVPYEWQAVVRIIDGTEGYTGLGDTLTVTTVAALRVQLIATLWEEVYDSATVGDWINSATQADDENPPDDDAGWGSVPQHIVAWMMTDATGSTTAGPTSYTLTEETSDAGGAFGDPLDFIAYDQHAGTTDFVEIGAFSTSSVPIFSGFIALRGSGAHFSGDIVERTIDHGDGTGTFDVTEAFTSGTLDVWVDDLPVETASEDASAGTFTLDDDVYHDASTHPSGCAVLRVHYEKA